MTCRNSIIIILCNITVLVQIPLSISQNFIVLSNEPVNAYFDEKLILHAFILSVCPVRVWKILIVFNLHITALFSIELAIKNSLSIDIATSITGL
jgi:hypothetical protein